MTKITLTLILLGSLAFANEVNIDVQIEQIKNASAQERVELMNEFKVQLSEMNQEDRTQTISKLQEEMRAQHQENEDAHSSSTHDASVEHTQAEHTEMAQSQDRQHNASEDMQENAQMLQMEQNEQMQQNQQMNQQQAGNQYLNGQENMTQDGAHQQDIGEGFMQRQGH
ncbi:hypothetical protein JHD50_03725 [Sulfurimonas sp. MAG313]|nr:hypothetical protein [Sulfurimonas sp. MAG313]MDF1880420.1 hypothetical protein [Sulfurimonas sp. MAG313]